MFMKAENVEVCHVAKEKRENDRGELLFLPIMLLCCSEVMVGASKTPHLKAFFLSTSSSRLSLRPRRVSHVHSLHHCRTTGCFTKPTFHCSDFSLPLFLPDSFSLSCSSVSLSLSDYSFVFSYSLNMDCSKAMLDWFPL